MTTTGNHTSNSDSNKIPHGNTLNRLSAPPLNTSDIQIQTITTPKDTYKPDSSHLINTNSIANFEEKKQIIMDTDALSHPPTLCNKILQELTLNGLCQHSNSHKAYIFEKSNHTVNCSYMLIFLRQSMCCHYVTHTHTHTPVIQNQYT